MNSEGETSMSKNICFGLAIAMAAIGASVASAQWGDLKVKFVCDGPAPTLPPLEVTKDKEICTAGGKKKVINEEFIVAKDGGLKDVIVFLVPEKGKAVKVHDSYKDSEKATITLDNKNCAFVPHVVLVRTGQTFVLTNSDPAPHNSKFSFAENKKDENPLLPPKGEFKVKPEELTKREIRATPISCAIHPWMQGWALVQDHPYMATSQEDGTLEIKNVPAGKHTFMFWQENVGYVPSSGKLKTSKGKMEIEIKEGVNDLGEVKVKPKAK
jgi:hypothetical protein